MFSFLVNIKLHDLRNISSTTLYHRFVFRHFVLCYVMLCYVMLCYVMLCYVMLCYVMLCYVMLCYVMLPQNQTARYDEHKCSSVFHYYAFTSHPGYKTYISDLQSKIL